MVSSSVAYFVLLGRSLVSVITLRALAALFSILGVLKLFHVQKASPMQLCPPLVLSSLDRAVTCAELAPADMCNAAQRTSVLDG